MTMTIEKAIKILKTHREEIGQDCSYELDIAIQLGIEALKLLLYGREHRYLFPRERLPGETKES